MRLTPKFLSVKEVPFLFWSSPKALTIKPPLISVVFLIIGLTLFGLGEALLVAAGVGVSPWTVLAQGIMNVTGWSCCAIISVSFKASYYSYLLLTRVCWPQLTGGYYIPSRRGETSWSVRGSERWVHWRGDSLEIHGTNPQWEHLAVDEVYDVDPRATPV